MTFFQPIFSYWSNKLLAVVKWLARWNKMTILYHLAAQTFVFLSFTVLLGCIVQSVLTQFALLCVDLCVVIQLLKAPICVSVSPTFSEIRTLWNLVFKPVPGNPLSVWHHHLTLLRHFSCRFYTCLNLQVTGERCSALPSFWHCSKFLNFNIYFNSSKTFYDLAETANPRAKPCQRAFTASQSQPQGFLLSCCWWPAYFWGINIAQNWAGVRIAPDSGVHEGVLPTISERNTNNEDSDRYAICKQSWKGFVTCLELAMGAAGVSTLKPTLFIISGSQNLLTDHLNRKA